MMLVIGSRGSKLALLQAEWVKNKLQGIAPGANISIKKIKTLSDKFPDAPLSRIGSKAAFTSEVEEALLKRDIDLAVHSMKDISIKMPDGLIIGAMPLREDPRDALISKSGRRLDELPKGARIGTSSLRRRTQLLHHRQDLEIVELRGNLDTRLKKLASDSIDAIVVAAAGIIRLGLEDCITERIPTDVMLPAAGQGALGIQIRGIDSEIAELLKPLDHYQTHQCITAERSFLECFGGSCRIPVSVYGSIFNESLKLEGAVASLDGKRVIRASFINKTAGAEDAGKQLAEKIIKSGAGEILETERYSDG